MLKKIIKIVVCFSLAFCLFLSGCTPRFLLNSPSRLVGFEVDYASNLNINRRAHTATLLKNGDLFIAGGETYIAELDRFVPLNRCEIYDVKKEMFLNNATLDNPRSQHTATLLNDGRVLIAGGKNGSKTLFCSELYNPSQNMSVAAPPLENSRYAHTATLVANGFVLLANGNSGKKPLSTVEVYSPLANNFKLVGRTYYKGANRTATLLKNGFILFTGGWYTENGALYYNKGA